MCPVDQFVIISHVIGVYSVFPVRAIDALLRCLHPFTSPYQPHPPVNVRYLHMYGTCDVNRGGVGSTWIRFMWLRFTNFSPCVRWPHARSLIVTFDDGLLLHHVPRCRLKNCSVVLLGLWRTMVKGGSADLATGKRRMWMRRTSAFYPSYTAMTVA